MLHDKEFLIEHSSFPHRDCPGRAPSRLPPLFAGWVKMVKCWFQGRTSPSLFQPYRDIRKLFSKDVMLAENASWIFRFTPYLVFGVSVMAGGIIPIAVDGPAAVGHGRCHRPGGALCHRPVLYRTGRHGHRHRLRRHGVEPGNDHRLSGRAGHAHGRFRRLPGEQVHLPVPDDHGHRPGAIPCSGRRWSLRCWRSS